MHLMMAVTLCKNINKLLKQGHEVDDNNNNEPDNILNLYTKRDNPTYNHWVQYGIGWIKESGNHHERDSCPCLVKN